MKYPMIGPAIDETAEKMNSADAAINLDFVGDGQIGASASR